MDRLGDIMRGRKVVAPDEITAIKNYILERYKSPCSVKLNQHEIILSVSSSALAASIQLEKRKLVDACGLGQKRLVIRTGS